MQSDVDSHAPSAPPATMAATDSPRVLTKLNINVKTVQLVCLVVSTHDLISDTRFDRRIMEETVVFVMDYVCMCSRDWIMVNVEST